MRHNSLEDFKTSPFVLKAVVEPICKRLSKKAILENFVLKPYPQMKKKLISTNHSTKITNTLKKEKCIPFLSIMSAQHLSNSCKTRMPPKKTKFYLVFGGQKHDLTIRRTPTGSGIKRLHYYLSNNKYGAKHLRKVTFF